MSDIITPHSGVMFAHDTPKGCFLFFGDYIYICELNQNKPYEQDITYNCGSRRQLSVAGGGPLVRMLLWPVYRVTMMQNIMSNRRRCHRLA